MALTSDLSSNPSPDPSPEARRAKEEARRAKADERRKLRESCRIDLQDFREPSPAEEFRLIADWFEARGRAHDSYGEGALIEGLERQVADLAGKPAAAFMPSGVMAQLIAVRIHTQRAGLPRFGLHPASHLVRHESEAYQAVFSLHGAIVGDRLRPMTAADLANQPGPLACLLVELPIREAGGQLPTWDELEALKAAARARRIPLHMDGARLWESRPFYGRPYAEIAEGFASVYVSGYKALGGLAGALLAGDHDFIAEAKLWRRRMGGTLIRQSPMIASIAMRLETRLALMDACFDRARKLAQALSGEPGFRVNPSLPHVNRMLLYIDAPAAEVLERRDAVAKAEGVWLIGGARPAEIPGWGVAEIVVGDTLLELGDEVVLPLMRQLLPRKAAKGDRPNCGGRGAEPRS